MIKLRKRSIFVNDSYFKMIVHLQYLKGIQSCKLQGMCKGVPFVNTRYMKGLPFSFKIGPGLSLFCKYRKHLLEYKM